MTCFVGVAVFGVLWGIGVAIGLSVAAFLWRAWHPYDAVLGRAPGVKGYHDLTRYPEARQVPGLLLYRFDAPLFFANAAIFRERLLSAVRESSVPISLVVVAAEPITDLDSTAADMLAELDRELETRNTELAFAEMKDPVKDRLPASVWSKALDTSVSIRHGVAVRKYVDEHDVDWVDWEDTEEWVAATASRG